MTLKRATILLLIGIGLLLMVTPYLPLLPSMRSTFDVHPILAKGLAAGCIFAILAALINFFSVCINTGRENLPAAFDGQIVMRLKAGARWLFGLSGVSLSVLFLIALWDMHGDFLGLAFFWGGWVFFCYAILAVFLTKVTYGEEQIRGQTWYFTEKRANWFDLKSVEPALNWQDYLKLRFIDGQTIRVSPLMEGYQQLLEFAQEQLNDA